MRTPNNERLTPDIAGFAKARPAPEPGRSCPAESEPERCCILSGDVASRQKLVRLALSPADRNGRCRVLPDVQEKAPGRGAWIGVGRADLERAIAEGALKRALARAFKGMVPEIPQDLPELTEQALRKTLLDRLGLEMRVGTLVLGSERIAEQARQGRISLLLHVADASEDGRKRLDQAWRVGREKEGSNDRGLILPLDRTALSVALGRDNVVHLAVGNAAAAKRIGNALGRLHNFLNGQLSVQSLRSLPRAERQDDNLPYRQSECVKD